MIRYSNWLRDGLRDRGHSVTVLAPKAFLHQLPLPRSLKKWMGYIDEFCLFPLYTYFWIKKKGKANETLFVFTDQAQGPWVPLVSSYAHVIHCHDFLALRSALGEFPQNSIGWTGRQYQNMIRRGFQEGQNFISVSKKTKDDLHRFLAKEPNRSEVVYNGLNPIYKTSDRETAKMLFSKYLNVNLEAGYLLHIGGNHWYKNRSGVIEIYNAWRSMSKTNLALIMLGECPSSELLEQHSNSPFKDDIYFVSDINDEHVTLAYCGTDIFLFPSYAEGFGWPIAEAMACGALVITTDDAPMTEVAGGAAALVPIAPSAREHVAKWAGQVANVLEGILNLDDRSKNLLRKSALENIRRFDSDDALMQIEKIYKVILKKYSKLS